MRMVLLQKTKVQILQPSCGIHLVTVKIKPTDLLTMLLLTGSILTLKITIKLVMLL